MNIAVLGGSTPFVLPLIDELQKMLPGRLHLHGRNPGALSAVEAYAQLRLAGVGWSVCATPELTAAVDAADVIVHQIRYGDLDGRKRDEQVAAMLELPADETLGPAGLQAALRAAPAVRELAWSLRVAAPQAIVLNLTNPLSVTTAVFASAGVEVWGMCELPALTQLRIASLLGVSPSGLDWAYYGLNHRGFLHGFRVGDQPIFDEVMQVADRIDPGIAAQDIAELGAVPVKYFGLRHGHAPHGAGRAAELEGIRTAALRELQQAPTQLPASLAGRDMPWYALSVAPGLHSLATGATVSSVVNLPGPEGLVREHRATLTGRDVGLVPEAAPPGPVDRWVERFETHERAVLTAIGDPNNETIAKALALDPLLAPTNPERAARLISHAG